MLKNIKSRVVSWKYWQEYNLAKRKFDNAEETSCFLPAAEFEKFITRYGKIYAAPAQDYSTEGMVKLAKERVAFIHNKIKILPGAVLEIGPGSGFVLKEFKEQGVKRATAIDINDSLYPEVKAAGVEFIKTSAEKMDTIPNANYDLIVSWSALEHIPDPEKVFNECLRILKPGGYIFLQFGPLYYSPWGYHHYSILKCPYLHILFPETLIHEYARKVKGEDYSGFLPWTNGKSIDYYQFLHKPLPYGYLLDQYESGYDIFSSRMIRKYPGIFRSKKIPFESFFVDWINIGIYKSIND